MKLTSTGSSARRMASASPGQRGERLRSAGPSPHSSGLREDTRGEIAVARADRFLRLVELGDLQGDSTAHDGRAMAETRWRRWSKGPEPGGSSTWRSPITAGRFLADHGTGGREAVPRPHQRSASSARGSTDSRCSPGSRWTSSPTPSRHERRGSRPARHRGRLSPSRLNMEAPAMTDRVLRAFSSPHLRTGGHPLARLILKRDP